MTMGDTIRKYRKQLGLTQEEMARRLGVTTPAVNKWENNNTLPDVALLAPLARLLGITTDELLSFQAELTEEEIQQFVLQIQNALKEESYHDVFLMVKRKLEAYPRCDQLIWQAAALLDAHRSMHGLPDEEPYDSTIRDWYERCLASEQEQIRMQAADSLFYAAFRREDYEKALQYMQTFPPTHPERKRREALVYSKTGRREEAYRMHEELLFSTYQQLQATLTDLRLLYMEDDNHAMAHRLDSVFSLAASAFDMGQYHEVCSSLDVAAWEKDVAGTERCMRKLLSSLDTITDFTRSELYQHMTFRAIEPAFSDSLRNDLLHALDDETFSYMESNEYWETLKRMRPPAQA